MQVLAAAVLALAAGAAQAQSSCEQFRDKLAERIEAGAKGMALEIAAGSVAVPSGAKVVGTCEGGARKVLLFRSPAAAAAWAGSVGGGAAGASAPPPAGAKTVERAAPAAAAASKAEPAARPPVVETPAATRVETAPAPAVATAPVPTQPASAAIEPSVARDADPSSSAAATPLATRVADWFKLRWPWFVVPLALLIAAGLWAWIAYRRAYDDYGLPRGPRLRA